MMANELTPKQEKFVQGLFVGLSQRQAYKEAYDAKNMKDKSIDEKSCELASNVKIKARLTELQDEVKEKNKWTVERLIDEFVEIKERCKTEIPVLDSTGQETGEYKFDSNGAIKSLENIGKLLKMYTDKVEHSGETGVKIIYDIPRKSSKSS
jgi:phage terminase small subunit